MASIHYNGDVVNATLSSLNALSGELSSLSSGLNSAASQIVSARGFNEYVGGLSSDTFGGYVDQCKGYVTGLSDFIRGKQVQILAYDGDQEEINAFLSSLDRLEYKRLDLSPISGYISDEYKVGLVARGFLSGLAVAGLGLAEGLGEFAETGADLVILASSIFKTVFTKGYDFIHGTDTTKELWDRTRAKVSEKRVESAFDSFYANTSAGRYLRDNAYNYDKVRSIGKGLGYTAGVIGLTVLTGGMAAGGIGAAGSVSAANLGMTAGVMGFSKSTQNAWADGATTEKGLLYGAASGAWEGAQWFLGAKINQFGGFGDKIGGKIAKGIFKGAETGVGSRVFLDTVDSGLEGFVQPALSMIYKDYGKDSIVDNYKSAFAANGAWGGVATQAAIGGIASGFGEYVGARRLLKAADSSSSYKPMTDAEIAASQQKLGLNADGSIKTAAGSSYKPMTDAEILASQQKLGIDGSGGAKHIFESDGNIKAVADSSSSSYKPMTDAEIKASQQKLGFDGEPLLKPTNTFDDMAKHASDEAVNSATKNAANDLAKWAADDLSAKSLFSSDGTKAAANTSFPGGKPYDLNADKYGMMKPGNSTPSFRMVQDSAGHSYFEWSDYKQFLESNKVHSEVAFHNATNSQRVFVTSYVTENGLPTSYKTMNGFIRDNLFDYSDPIMRDQLSGNVRSHGLYFNTDNMNMTEFLDSAGGCYTLSELVDINHKAILEIDQLMRDNPMASNMVTYRGIDTKSAATIFGIDPSAASNFDSFRKAVLNQGGFETEGFFSTSATKFSDPVSSKNIVYVLKNREGTPALDMSRFGGIPSEEEILIGANTKYRYVDVQSSGGKWYVICETDPTFDAVKAGEIFRSNVDDKFARYSSQAAAWEAKNGVYLTKDSNYGGQYGVPKGYSLPYDYHKTADGVPENIIKASDLDPNAISPKILTKDRGNYSNLPADLQKELMGDDIPSAVSKQGPAYLGAPSFKEASDLFQYAKDHIQDPGGSELVAAAFAKHLDEVGGSAGYHGAKYYEFLNLGDSGIPPEKSAAIMHAIINEDKELREQIAAASLDELQIFKNRFGMSDAEIKELSDCILGKDFVDSGLGAGANWKKFGELMEEPMSKKVQASIDAGKEPVIWSGFSGETHELMDQHFTTISNSSIGGTYFIESAYSNWDGNSTPFKTVKLWEDLSAKYAQACCEAIDPATGVEISNIKFLYPMDKQADQCFGQLFKSQELPEIAYYGTVDTITLARTNPATMEILDTVEVDISDICEYCEMQGFDPSVDEAMKSVIFDMFLKKVKEVL